MWETKNSQQAKDFGVSGDPANPLKSLGAGGESRTPTGARPTGF